MAGRRTRPFLVPEGVHEHFAEKMGARGAKLSAEWEEMFARYRAEYPDLAKELDLIAAHELPEGWDARHPELPRRRQGPRLARQQPEGAERHRAARALADRAAPPTSRPSTKSNMTFQGAGSFEAHSYGGRNLHFGIREHAMGAIVNGMATYGLRSYGSGFLIF